MEAVDSAPLCSVRPRQVAKQAARRKPRWFLSIRRWWVAGKLWGHESDFSSGDLGRLRERYLALGGTEKEWSRLVARRVSMVS